MASRNQRFTSDGKDIVTSDVQLSLTILKAVEMPQATDADLVKGLEHEIQSDVNLKSDWNNAVEWFKHIKKTGDWAKNEKYHLALYTFSLDAFYSDFNKACRNLKSVEEAKSFKFRFYFNLLLRGIRNVEGDPKVVDNSTKLFRGCNVLFPKLVVNEQFLFNQFTSTSLDKKKAEDFLDHHEGALFIVDGINHGRIGNQTVIGLKNHSAFPSEAEVLTSPFLIFKIMKIEKAVKGIVYVHLKVA